MNDRVFKELERIRKKSGGILHPEDVVKTARDEGNVLNKYFDWDDTTAAQKYRLFQARQLIRVSVKVLQRSDKSTTIKAYVNLSDERHKEGSYRSTIDVMSDELMRERLLDQALRELLAFKKKYEELEELAEILRAIDDVAS